MYGATQAAATPEDLNIPYPPAAPFGGHRKEEPESELSHHRNQTPQQQQQQMSSGLARFRSAPSSFLGELCEELIPARPSETENMFARFMAPPDLQDNPPHGATVDCQRRHQFRPPPPPPDEMVSSHHKAALSSTPPMIYRHSQQRLHMPNHKLTDSSQQAVGSMAMEADGIDNGGGRSSSDLTRQSSSPVGLFSNLNVDNGYAMMRGMGGFRNGDLPPMGDASSRLKGQLSFASTQNSLMSQISETGSKEINPGGHGESSHAGRSYIPGVSMTCWEETYLLPPSNFSGMKRSREDEGKIMNQSQSQNGEMRGHVSGLTHQLSLPKTSSEMAAIEKFLQFQDAVPCRTRAKRGCATHPRSIAERVRRTKISERMRKLQELVPNMDKQTNTADMLDLAVDYINDLQKQVKTLTEGRATCTCLSSKQKSYLSSGVRDC